MASETHVGRLLREARAGRFKGRRTGLRQIEESLGISRPTLNHWETGRTRTIPIAQAMALAKHLEVPLDVLEQAAIEDASELHAAAAGESLPAGDDSRGNERPPPPNPDAAVESGRESLAAAPRRRRSIRGRPKRPQ